MRVNPNMEGAVKWRTIENWTVPQTSDNPWPLQCAWCHKTQQRQQNEVPSSNLWWSIRWWNVQSETQVIKSMAGNITVNKHLPVKQCTRPTGHCWPVPKHLNKESWNSSGKVMYELCNEMYTKFPTYLPNLGKKWHIQDFQNVWRHKNMTQICCLILLSGTDERTASGCIDR